jgi:uncharacterized membrane protein
MSKQLRAIIIASITTAFTMLCLDLAWLGLIAQPIYESLLGPLKRPEVFWPPALLFYLMYVIFTLRYAVFTTATISAAARQGAALGGLAYATYELTNWAVLRDWPPLLVPIDIIWGIALTATAAAVGKLAHLKAQRP